MTHLSVPQEMGAHIKVEACNDALKGEVEARGFFPVVITPQYRIYRRDYPDRALKTAR